MSDVVGLLTSQIGYDLGLPMRALVRGPLGTLPTEGARFRVEGADGSPSAAQEGAVPFWGELWGSAWWIADFSGISETGAYRLIVSVDAEECFRSEPFDVGPNLLWERTFPHVALGQGERRQRIARDGVGWFDAGMEWMEANSQAGFLVGLLDTLERAGASLDRESLRRLEAQIVNGCSYLARLQDVAAGKPGGEGALVHQIWRFDDVILPGDVSKAALVWARASRLPGIGDAALRAEYRERAERALGWLRTATPMGGSGFSRINHGALPDAPVPDEWMTRDLLIQCEAALELALAGSAASRAECIALAQQVMARQVLPDAPEGELYGHFRTFDSANYTEKAWVHNGEGGIFGADAGGQFPFRILPLMRMAEAWPDHADAPKWREAVRRFAYGFFLPACQANPFLLLPLGYFEGEGLLWFAGLWHGMNAAYGFAAALAAEFGLLYGDPAFQEIAVGNLQWIAGLNAGITAESLFACHLYSRDVPDGVALPVSMIQGIGARQAGGWLTIRGSICNGFSVGDQFRFDSPATRAADGPHAFTDEDWITHSGGWLSGICRLAFPGD